MAIRHAAGLPSGVLFAGAANWSSKRRNVALEQRFTGYIWRIAVVDWVGAR